MACKHDPNCRDPFCTQDALDTKCEDCGHRLGVHRDTDCTECLECKGFVGPPKSYVGQTTNDERVNEIDRLSDAEREARLKQALQDLDDQRKDAQ